MALFGYDYSKGAGDTLFNPWVTYDGNNVDGYYNARLDANNWQNNGQAESSRARVWRWTLDDLRRQGVTNPGAADMNVVRAAYLNNVARLRRDIEAPDNAARGLTWQNSGFAGYDKYLTGDQTRPPTGQRPGDNAQVAGQPPPPGDIIPPKTTTTLPGGLPALPDPASTGPKTPGPGGPAGPASGLNAPASAALAEDPDFAFRYMMEQLGMNPNVPGYFSSFLKKKFSPLLQARLAAANLNSQGTGNPGEYLDQIGNTVSGFGQAAFSRGGGFYGDLANIAQQAAGNASGYLSGLEDQDQVKGYLDQLATLKYAGANPLVQQALADTITRGYEQYKWDSFMRMNEGQQGDPYLEWLRSNKKYNQYLPI